MPFAVTFGQLPVYVPLKVSIKFIVDANGNRPAVGRFNTDQKIMAEFNAGNAILWEHRSEIRLYNIEGEIVDLSTNAAAWNTTHGSEGRDLLRDAAISDPDLFLWRTNAINIYINNGSDGAISCFPPNNNIILMGQNCAATPSCMLHELGHSLNLYHTHEGGGDGCDDTLPDNADWTKDDISTNAFGVIYANLTPEQRTQVDMTYNNIMSYHFYPPQRRLTPCQLDRISRQLYQDRQRLAAKEPVHVRAAYSGPQDGSFDRPYTNAQAALNAVSMTGKVMVLEQGNYTITQSIVNVNMDIVPRSGEANINFGNKIHDYDVDFSKSKNPNVVRLMRAVQDSDTRARQAEREARHLEAKAGSDPTLQSAVENLKQQAARHHNESIMLLHQAESQASGPERILMILELAQRYELLGELELASFCYDTVGNETDQVKLQRFVRGQSEVQQKRLRALRAPPTQEK